MNKNSALKTGATALAVATVGFGVAACGSSSKAAGVVTAPGAGATVAAVTSTAAATTTTAAATSTVTTPTSGPLAKEPTASKPSGPAPTKLVKKVLVQGSGTAIAKGDSATINFFGYLYSTGKPFSGGSTWTSATKATPYGPVQIGEGDFIKGFDDGLIGVKAGSRVQLIIPPSLGYGSKAQSSIPANSTLIFDIDVLAVSK
jgi:FKBP-type peptidyl-prolyl cis-trans isomerase